jgi:hypothetical protein
MQDFKQRRAVPRKPWLKRRFRLGLRRGRAALPKGFRPLPAPPATRRESAWRLPRLRRVRPPLAVIYGAILVWLAAGVVWNGWDLLTGPLAKVRLSGNHRLSGAQVLAAAGLAPGLPMNDVDPIAVTRRLTVHAHVAAADVRRAYPDSLWIDVRERTPALRVQAGEELAVIDTHDVVIDAGTVPAESAGLPLVRGLGALPAPGQAVSDPALRRAREFLALLREAGGAGERVSEIDGGRAYMLSVRFRDGRRMLFSSENVARELRIWRDLAAAENGPVAAGGSQTLDLRAAAQEDGRIALRP